MTTTPTPETALPRAGTAAALVRYGYVPLMLLGVNGAAITLMAAGRSKAWLLVLLALAISLSFAAERVLPYHRPWNAPLGDRGRDLAHAVVNEGMPLLSLATFPVIAQLTTAADLWPSDWPFLVQVLVAILVADAGLTLAHYVSHRSAVLWRFHAVHHSVKRFYGFNGLMKHPVHQTAETLAGLAPLLIIGIPVPVAGALTLAVAVQLLLQHSNADYRVGPLKHVLALNEAHRFHHLKWAGIGDVNFGLFTLIWDHALRTHSYDPARAFTSDDLGMAAKPHFPVRYLAQLAEPFRTGRAATGAKADPAAPADAAVRVVPDSPADTAPDPAALTGRR